MNEILFPFMLMFAIISLVELVSIIFLVGLVVSLKCDLAKMGPLRGSWPDAPVPKHTDESHVTADVLNISDAERDWNKDIKPKNRAKKPRKRPAKPAKE